MTTNANRMRPPVSTRAARNLDMRIGEALFRADNGDSFRGLLEELRGVGNIEDFPDDVFRWILCHDEARHVDAMINAGVDNDVGVEPKNVFRHLALKSTEQDERRRGI